MVPPLAPILAFRVLPGGNPRTEGDNQRTESEQTPQMPAEGGGSPNPNPNPNPNPAMTLTLTLTKVGVAWPARVGARPRALRWERALRSATRTPGAPSQPRAAQPPP